MQNTGVFPQPYNLTFPFEPAFNAAGGIVLWDNVTRTCEIVPVPPAPLSAVRSTTTMRYKKVASTTTPGIGEFSESAGVLYFNKTDDSARDSSNNFVYLGSLISANIPSVFLLLDNDGGELIVSLGTPLGLNLSVYSFVGTGITWIDGDIYTFDQIVIRPSRIALLGGNDVDPTILGATTGAAYLDGTLDVALRQIGTNGYIGIDQNVLATVQGERIKLKCMIDGSTLDMTEFGCAFQGPAGLFFNSTGSSATIQSFLDAKMYSSVGNVFLETLNGQGISFNFHTPSVTGVFNVKADNIDLNCASITAPLLPSATTAKVVYFDPVTFALSQGDPASTTGFITNDLLNAPLSFGSATGDVTMITTAGGMASIDNTETEVACSAENIRANLRGGGGQFDISYIGGNLFTASVTADRTWIYTTAIRFPNITTATQTNCLYIDANGDITKGAAPTAPFSAFNYAGFSSNGTSSGGVQNQINWIQGSLSSVSSNAFVTLGANNTFTYNGGGSTALEISYSFTPNTTSTDRTLNIYVYVNPDALVNPTVGQVTSSKIVSTVRSAINATNTMTGFCAVVVAPTNTIRFYCQNTETADPVTFTEANIKIKNAI